MYMISLFKLFGRMIVECADSRNRFGLSRRADLAIRLRPNAAVLSDLAPSDSGARIREPLRLDAATALERTILPSSNSWGAAVAGRSVGPAASCAKSTGEERF